MNLKIENLNILSVSIILFLNIWKSGGKVMKILIVNENIIGGGAEQSCLKMKKLLEEHEQEVYYLTFDDRFYEKTENMINKNNIINIKVNKNIINKLIFFVVQLHK